MNKRRLSSLFQCKLAREFQLYLLLDKMVLNIKFKQYKFLGQVEITKKRGRTHFALCNHQYT